MTSWSSCNFEMTGFSSLKKLQYLIFIEENQVHQDRQQMLTVDEIKLAQVVNLLVIC